MDTSVPVAISGKIIILRDWILEDLSAFEKWQKPGHEWQSFDGPYYRGHQDESGILAERLKTKIKERDFGFPRSHLVVADLETNKILGTVSSYWESKETNWLCIGIVIYDSQSDWRRGIGFEALGLWMDYLFQNHPEIVRLDMRSWSGNTGLIKLAAKLGFTQEACFRKARIVNGQYFDGLGFGILREEWLSMKSTGRALSEV